MNDALIVEFCDLIDGIACLQATEVTSKAQ